ncbi:MAG: endolytic transglycosylase MltG [Armatimonadota bacterium]
MKKFVADTKLYIVVLLAALCLVTWGLVVGSMPVSFGDKKPVRVMITQGATARTIADTLQKSGIIRSPMVFLLTSKMGGVSEKLKPGVYEMSRAMSTPEIVRSLVQGNTLESWVTIPEGKTLREIADILAAKQLADADTFLGLTTLQGDRFASYSLPYDGNLEGYLFPDTYLIERGTTTDDVIKMMLDTFERKVVKAHRDEIETVIKSRFGLGANQFDYGLRRVLIIASIIEREAKTADDRPKIAAVIWNRLSKNMKLEIDATVTYRLGESRANKAKVYYRDLENSSLYNTYRHAGLPPAPICNPGLASILATLRPADIDALYYVAKKDGSHVFNRTLAEHNASKKAKKEGNL